jgi:hypothetical protein
VSVELTAIRFSTGGRRHEDITDIWWTNSSTGYSGRCTVKDMVEWIRTGGGAYVGDGDGRRSVWVVQPVYGPMYLRAHADDRLTDDLLALPRR